LGIEADQNFERRRLHEMWFDKIEKIKMLPIFINFANCRPTASSWIKPIFETTPEDLKKLDTKKKLWI
jgi:hypothetical protein